VKQQVFEKYQRLFEDPVTISTNIPKSLRPEMPYKGDDSGDSTDSSEVKKFKKKIKSLKSN
jgi:hypothetical protein